MEPFEFSRPSPFSSFPALNSQALDSRSKSTFWRKEREPRVFVFFFVLFLFFVFFFSFLTDPPFRVLLFFACFWFFGLVFFFFFFFFFLNFFGFCCLCFFGFVFFLVVCGCGGFVLKKQGGFRFLLHSVTLPLLISTRTKERVGSKDASRRRENSVKEAPLPVVQSRIRSA